MTTTDDDAPEVLPLAHGLVALLLPAEESLTILEPFHISPRRAEHYTDQLPEDDPGVDLFTKPADEAGPEWT